MQRPEFYFVLLYICHKVSLKNLHKYSSTINFENRRNQNRNNNRGFSIDGFMEHQMKKHGFIRNELKQITSLFFLKLLKI